MKRRQGFVSNSSTTSFCIYGSEVGDFFDNPIELCRRLKKAFPEEYGEMVKSFKSSSYRKELGNILERIDEDLKPKKVRQCDHKIESEDVKYCPFCGNEVWIEDENDPVTNFLTDEDYFSDYLDDIFTFFGAYYTRSEIGDYLGLSYDDVADDVTFGEFRAKAEKLLKMVTGKKVKCEHLEKAYYS